MAIVVGLTAGALISLPSIRTKSSYFLILTFAAGEFVRILETRARSITGGVDGMTLLPGRQEVVGLRLADRVDFYLLAVALMFAILLVLLALIRSPWGAVLRGIRENPDLAASIGINVTKHRIMAFAVSGAAAAVGGQFFLYQSKFIAPDLFGQNLSILFVLTVLLGGREFLLGPLVGTVVYIFLPEVIFLSPIRSQMVLGLALAFMILAAPAGLVGLVSDIWRWIRGYIPRDGEALGEVVGQEVLT
jgi:branched-chain amino acid transport system permease protein